MLKKSIVLLISLVMTLSSISQTVTVQNDTTETCIPTYQLKQAIIDIQKGDECALESIWMNDNINILKQQISYKDLLIFNSEKKQQSFKAQISEYKQNEESYTEAIKIYDKALKKSKVKSIALGTTGLVLTIGSVITITYLALFK